MLLPLVGAQTGRLVAAQQTLNYCVLESSKCGGFCIQAWLSRPEEVCREMVDDMEKGIREIISRL